MTHFLVCRLYSPLTAWSEPAIGEYRAHAVAPAKSALVGLLAAALGISRQQQAAWQSLQQSYLFAVQIESRGEAITDFHTTQTATKTHKLKHLYTRRDELKGELKTVLSKREYRCDACYTVCLYVNDDNPPYSLDALQLALQQPVFTLYLGRKSCPLAWPVSARQIQADRFEQAIEIFNQADIECWQALADNMAQPMLPWTIAKQLASDSSATRQVDVYWDTAMPTRQVPLQTHWRSDHALTRRPWQFTQRQECYARMEIAHVSE
ncbi:type I-E CRISPR-associated protein Cas5/CasD [Candidatus Venteria ishoeyi]|nr:type I-E CRISPR-associated protein Cas5/CasD [Candidatus Venteria ishoeyi]